MPADVQPPVAAIPDLLHRWLARQIDAKALAWLDETRLRIAMGAPDRVFFAAYSAAPHHTGKQHLSLMHEDIHAAGIERTGWEQWRVDQAGRALLLLAIDSSDADSYAGRLDRLSTCADLDESIALYQCLSLLPHPRRLHALAAEGARSNMTAVFNAVALRNAYPAEHFDEASWNQLVLKALFVESPLHAIHGLDGRANRPLARMLVDYAHERWAASRPVSSELWRPVGPFANDNTIADLEKVLEDPDPAQQSAAALALSQSPSPRAAEVLARRTDLRTAIVEKRLSWDRFAEGTPAIQRLIHRGSPE